VIGTAHRPRRGAGLSRKACTSLQMSLGNLPYVFVPRLHRSLGKDAPRSPWQNGHIERLIGSIRRECLDHVVVLGEAHLRRVLKTYADYYNCVRIHLALEKDTPFGRPVQAIGRVVAIPLLGGLHHRYARMT
jgi:hypothetical protein